MKRKKSKQEWNGQTRRGLKDRLVFFPCIILCVGKSQNESPSSNVMMNGDIRDKVGRLVTILWCGPFCSVDHQIKNIRKNIRLCTLTLRHSFHRRLAVDPLVLLDKLFHYTCLDVVLWYLILGSWQRFLGNILMTVVRLSLPQEASVTSAISL